MTVEAIGAVTSSGAGSLVNRLYEQQAMAMLDGVSSSTGPSAALGAVDPGAAGRGLDFASVIGNGLLSLESLDRTAATRAVQAATGDLQDVHDYVIAATSMQTATELTTTVRNKALEAFSEIMRMQL